jgi:transcription antitermination factor NusA-like protein
MRINFDKKGNNYIEVKESIDKNHIVIILSSEDQNNFLKTIINSVEITKEQFRSMIQDLNLSGDENGKFNKEDTKKDQQKKAD